MSELNYVYYQGEQLLVGWFEEYPDYRTQGETLEEHISESFYIGDYMV